ncbi:unnamed protein product [Orchesella dallaii]|uniref:Uncharacterized protein n=1 Tax=Orchesella dallaii TaxID=48710 RepID=A0ABP1QLB5_9HEXA
MPDHTEEFLVVKRRTRQAVTELKKELEQSDCPEKAKLIIKNVLQETAENCADVPAKLPAEEMGKDALKEIEETWERIRNKCITSFDSGKKSMLKVAHKMTPDDQNKVAQFIKKLESVFSSLWDYICLVGKLIWQGIVSRNQRIPTTTSRNPQQSPVVEPKREGQRKDVEKTKETKTGVITPMRPKKDSSTKLIQ